MSGLSRYSRMIALCLLVVLLLTACSGGRLAGQASDAVTTRQPAIAGLAPSPTPRPAAAAVAAVASPAAAPAQGSSAGPATTEPPAAASVSAAPAERGSAPPSAATAPPTATATPVPASATPRPARPAPTSLPATPTAAPVAVAQAPAAAGRVAVAAASEPVTTTAQVTRTFSTAPNPLQIPVMRGQIYPGSPITVEQTLAPGANYRRYIVSYRSDGLKIYALMTVPNGPKPPTGWPTIVFNHGFIPPAIYRTTERYVAYVDAIARSGYIVFKSDYRGHGSSEGPTEGGGYGTPNYTVDVLNAVAALKAYPDVDPQRIGMWGHSMGGQITLRAMVVDPTIKAGVIWGGVVAPYPDLLSRWTRRATAEEVPASARRWRADLIREYGTPAQNPAFWASISPNSYLAGLSGPLQLHHSVTDEEVPVAFSQTLYDEAQAAGKSVELYTYPGDNHNINANFNTAMARSIAFFDKYVKGSGAAN